MNGRGPFQFIFDTGSVNLITPATSGELGLKSVGDMKARGAGTHTMKASFIKVKQLKIGNAIVNDQLFIQMPLDTLADQKRGAFAGSEFSGNIGGGILKRFVVTFDYDRKVMYLQPMRGPGADLDTFDRAGMWFNEGPTGFVIVDVTKGTPAANAGLMKGDLITAVDGTPAKSIKLYELRRRLRDGPSGSRVDFTIDRRFASPSVPSLRSETRSLP